LGGKTALVTAADDAVLRETFDAVLSIGASPKHNDIPTIQPLGNQFDQSMHLILDSLIIHLNKKADKDAGEIKAKHFNLEQRSDIYEKIISDPACSSDKPDSRILFRRGECRGRYERGTDQDHSGTQPDFE